MPKLIIDISNEMYKRITATPRCAESLDAFKDRTEFVKAIQNGTVLFKGLEHINQTETIIETPKTNDNSEDPYLIETVLITKKKYNPKYGDDKICKCGHTYYRHFDPWENMEPIGCKYCGCQEFVEVEKEKNNERK